MHYQNIWITNFIRKNIGDNYEDLLEIARERGLTCYHQMGTCKMELMMIKML